MSKKYGLEDWKATICCMAVGYMYLMLVKIWYCILLTFKPNYFCVLFNLQYIINQAPEWIRCLSFESFWLDWPPPSLIGEDVRPSKPLLCFLSDMSSSKGSTYWFEWWSATTPFAGVTGFFSVVSSLYIFLSCSRTLITCYLSCLNIWLYSGELFECRGEPKYPCRCC